jgi:ParB family chromosome partitioning protein
MTLRKPQIKTEVDFTDSYHQQNLKFKIIPIEKLTVVRHQRKPSSYHIKNLSSSIERIGFLVPLIVVEDKDDIFTIIDGQHRYLAAKELGIREVPVIVVPQKISQLMMNLNIEKELNIREKSHVALNIYRQYLEIQPEILESDPEIIDSLEEAYYVTLGLGYEKQEKLSGSSFESILKKCDFFLDEKLPDALKIREKRAEKVLTANSLVKEITQKLKEIGRWHLFVYQQIISYANPYKRKRLPTEFDDLFDIIIENLQKAALNPEIVLKEEVGNEFR